jgi:hypothetical protein
MKLILFYFYSKVKYQNLKNFRDKFHEVSLNTEMEIRNSCQNWNGAYHGLSCYIFLGKKWKNLRRKKERKKID